MPTYLEVTVQFTWSPVGVPRGELQKYVLLARSQADLWVFLSDLHMGFRIEHPAKQRKKEKKKRGKEKESTFLRRTACVQGRTSPLIGAQQLVAECMSQ